MTSLAYYENRDRDLNVLICTLAKYRAEKGDDTEKLSDLLQYNSKKPSANKLLQYIGYDFYYSISTTDFEAEQTEMKKPDPTTEKDSPEIPLNFENYFVNDYNNLGIDTKGYRDFFINEYLSEKNSDLLNKIFYINYDDNTIEIIYLNGSKKCKSIPNKHFLAKWYNFILGLKNILVTIKNYKNKNKTDYKIPFAQIFGEEKTPPKVKIIQATKVEKGIARICLKKEQEMEEGRKIIEAGQLLASKVAEVANEVAPEANANEVANEVERANRDEEDYMELGEKENPPTGGRYYRRKRKTLRKRKTKRKTLRKNKRKTLRKK